MLALKVVAGAALALNLTGGTHSVVSIVGAILGIAVLIALHEWGHYMACRLTGTRVETFSVGFGRRLFGWERVGDGPRRFTVGPRRIAAEDGGFDWRISLIPLGGYVKMAGEIGGDGTATSGLGAVRPPRADEYPSKSVPQRAFIAVAGVVMNALTAVAFFAVAYGVGYEDAPAAVGDVVPGGAAWKAGVRPGDRLRTYDGVRLRTYFDLREEVLLAPSGREAVLEVERDGAILPLKVTPTATGRGGLQAIGVLPPSTLSLTDGAGGSLAIGPFEAARVDGRPARGGLAVEALLGDAREAGRSAARVETERGALTFVLRAPPSGAEAAGPAIGPYRLGITAYQSLRVAALRPGGAAAALLRVGDEVVAADGEPVARRGALRHRARLARLEVRRGAPAEIVSIPLPAPLAGAEEVDAFFADVFFGDAAFGDAGGGAGKAGGPLRVEPSGALFADGVGPAGAAGLRPGDILHAVAGKKVSALADVIALGPTLTAAPVALEVETPGEGRRTLTVLPGRASPSALPGKAELVPAKETVPVDGVLDAAALGAKRTWSTVRNVFRTIARFISGDISFGDNVSGPLTIAQFSSSAASLGLSVYLAFLAFISVNLAVLNILPIPVLDGGTLMFLGYEAVRGRKPSDVAVGRLQTVGFLLLMLLMVFALRNDVKNLFGL